MKNTELEYKIYEFANRDLLLDFLQSHEWDRVDDGDVIQEYQIDLFNGLYWLRVPVEAPYINYGASVQDALITIARAYDYSSEIESVFRIVDPDTAEKCVDFVKDSINEKNDITELTDILDVFAKAMAVAASRVKGEGNKEWMKVVRKTADNCQYVVGLLAEV